MTGDGLPLFSTAHPIPPWWKRVWYFMRRPFGIRRSSLETVVIDIPSDGEFNTGSPRMYARVKAPPGGLKGYGSKGS